MYLLTFIDFVSTPLATSIHNGINFLSFSFIWICFIIRILAIFVILGACLMVFSFAFIRSFNSIWKCRDTWSVFVLVDPWHQIGWLLLVILLIINVIDKTANIYCILKCFSTIYFS